MDYPKFVWWYKGEQFKYISDKMKYRCDELGIDHYSENLQINKYLPELINVKSHLSRRRLLFRCGILWLRDLVASSNCSIFFIGANDKILIKPELEVFNNIDIGYSVGERLDKLRIILARGIYFKNTQLSNDFLNVLSYKCKTIRAERPTEHDLIRTTVFDFTGQLFDDKFVDMGTCKTSRSNFIYKNNICPLKGNSRKFIYTSAITKNTYIVWE